MIASGRRRHRGVWLVLAVLIPLLLVGAWLARPQPELMDRLPPELTQSTHP